MPVETKFQLCNYRDGSFALLPLWFAYLVSPYGLLYLDGVTVVALPKKAADFSLAGTRERRDGNNRRGGFGKNAEHPQFFLERISMCFAGRSHSGNLHVPHGVRRVEDTLSPGVTKYAAEKMLDVAERSGMPRTAHA